MTIISRSLAEKAAAKAIRETKQKKEPSANKEAPAKKAPKKRTSTKKARSESIVKYPHLKEGVSTSSKR